MLEQILNWYDVVKIENEIFGWVYQSGRLLRYEDWCLFLVKNLVEIYMVDIS